MKYEYVYGGDVFDAGDNNSGLMFGVESADGEYMEWFKSVKELEANTKKEKLKIANREMFLANMKKNKLM
jgi:hypothetical protein